MTIRHHLLIVGLVWLVGCDQFSTKNLGTPAKIRTNLGGPVKIPQEMLDRGFLGVGFSPERGADAEARISKVVPGSPAASAGLRVGDLIEKIDGSSLASAGEFLATAKTWKPRQTVSLELTRDGNRLSYNITLMTVEEFLPLTQAAGIP